MYRKRKDISNITKYFFVGLIAFIADFTCFYIAVNLFKINYFFAGFYGFTLGVYVNYILAKKFVFLNQNKITKNKEIFGVYFISGIGLLIHQLSIYLLIEIINNNLYVAKILTSFIVFLWNYNIRRRYLYGK